MGYDGFGRVTFVRAPVAGHSGTSECAANTVPLQRFEYELAVEGLPVSLVRAYAAKPPKLAGVMPGPATNDEVSALLHRCLAPNAAERPTAAELRAVLSGRGPRAEASHPSW